MKYLELVVVVVAFVAVASAKKSVLPSWIKPCKLDGNESKCIAENIELCRPHFTKGIPKLGVPPLSPFKIPEVSVQNNDLRITARDLTMHHIDKVQVKSLNVDSSQDLFNVDLLFPKLFATFSYQVQGRILLLHLNGQGAGNISLSGIATQAKLKGKRYIKEDKEYVNYYNIDVNFDVDDGKIFLANIFGPRDDLTINTNRLINENFKDFFIELKPLLIDAVSSFILNIAKNVFSIPLSDLFPN